MAVNIPVRANSGPDCWQLGFRKPSMYLARSCFVASRCRRSCLLGDAVWCGMPPTCDHDMDCLIHNLKPVDPSLILAPVAEETEVVVEVSVRGCIRAGSDLKGGPPVAHCHVAEDDSSSSEDEVMPLGTGKGAAFTDSI